MATASERIKEIMEERKLRQIDVLNLAKPFKEKYDIKFSKSHLSQYVNGKSNPDNEKIFLLSKIFNVSEAWLLGYDVPKNNESENTSSIDNKMQDKFSKLNLDNKKKAYSYTSNLLENQNNNQNNEIHELTQVYVVEKVAAGVGYSYGENEGTIYYTDREDLPPYDFATLVTGNSMIPDYEDGDVILLRQGYDSVDGDIYVIDYDSKSYVKKLYNDGTRFVLRSLNSSYEDIIIFKSDIENTYFNIVGKVIDSFKPVKK